VIEKQENSKKKRKLYSEKQMKKDGRECKTQKEKKEEYKNGRIKAKSDVSKKKKRCMKQRNYEEIGELVKMRERTKRRDKGKSYVLDERV